jgi:hypothetical protein
VSHSRREPAIFSSLTLEIDVPQGEPAEASRHDERRAIA